MHDIVCFVFYQSSVLVIEVIIGDMSKKKVCVCVCACVCVCVCVRVCVCVCVWYTLVLVCSLRMRVYFVRPKVYYECACL